MIFANDLGIMKMVAALFVMISFILVTVIVTAGKNPSSKHLYLVSFEYDSDVGNITKAATQVSDVINKFRKDSSDDNRAFTSVRVAYSGICTQMKLENKDNWQCGNLDTAELLGK